jgi:phospholipase C
VRIKFLAAGGVAVVAAVAATIGLSGALADSSSSDVATATPIKHVVVFFDENESFDHYFGTYPNATNPAGEPSFTAKPGTPSVNGLTPALLTANPNLHNPARLDRTQAVTCSQNHGYTPEQQAEDNGLMDKFELYTAGGSCTDKSIVMDYYDGNTVTGLWNLAQNFALNDNSFGTQFGPSTVGALNLISGQTHGANGGSSVINGTVTGDPDPSTANDDCGNGTTVMSGKNVGDLLNAKGVSWGWFQGGFRPSAVDSTTGKATCATSHANVAGVSINDYVPHHEPFEYYTSTANQHHTAPANVAEIGHDGRANHQYDLTDFDAAVENGTLPAVSFLKPAAFENAHPSNSDPLDEQRFVARTLDELEQSPEWSSTMVVIAYDDSDGWYDHVASPIVSPSRDATADQLNGVGICGTTTPDPAAYSDRCGYGARQPLMVISPYAKQNYVDHTLTDQTSVLKFIEDNWSLGQIGDQSLDVKAGSLNNMLDFTSGALAPKVFLDPSTGQVQRTEPVNQPTQTTTVSVPSPPQVSTQVVTVTTPAPAPVAPTPPASSSPSSSPTPSTGAPTTTSGGNATATSKRPKVTCKATKAGAKAVRVACTATGGEGTTHLRVRLAQHGHQLATAAGGVSHGKASVTLHTKQAIQSGSYTLTVTISTGRLAPKAMSESVKIA